LKQEKGGEKNYRVEIDDTGATFNSISNCKCIDKRERALFVPFIYAPAGCCCCMICKKEKKKENEAGNNKALEREETMAARINTD